MNELDVLFEDQSKVWVAICTGDLAAWTEHALDLAMGRADLLDRFIWSGVTIPVTLLDKLAAAGGRAGRKHKCERIPGAPSLIRFCLRATVKEGERRYCV